MSEFAAALHAAQADCVRKGIGTLGEKTLHLTLKYLFAPDPETHERKVGGYVADAVTEEGVIEIQTRSLARLKPKLDAFLACCPVTVVYPVIQKKMLIRMNEAGELLVKRQSPKHGSCWTAMRELYPLRQYMQDERFHVRLCLLDVEEYIVESGRSKRRRVDLVPVCLHELLSFDLPADYRALLPDFPEPFAVPDLAAQVGAGQECARYFLSVLSSLGYVQTCGRRGRYKLWKTVPENSRG